MTGDNNIGVSTLKTLLHIWCARSSKHWYQVRINSRSQNKCLSQMDVVKCPLFSLFDMLAPTMRSVFRKFGSGTEISMQSNLNRPCVLLSFAWLCHSKAVSGQAPTSARPPAAGHKRGKSNPSVAVGDKYKATVAAAGAASKRKPGGSLGKWQKALCHFPLEYCMSDKLPVGVCAFYFYLYFVYAIDLRHYLASAPAQTMFQSWNRFSSSTCK